MSHPYAAASVPLMAEKAGIYHTWPQYVYLPKQPRLDTFNNEFGNTLYLFEQRLSGSWKEAKNLGNFDKFIDTYELLENLHKDNEYLVDQRYLEEFVSINKLVKISQVLSFLPSFRSGAATNKYRVFPNSLLKYRGEVV